MASQGLGKLRGLTRPGSKIQLPVASDDDGSTSCDPNTNTVQKGQPLVGKVVRKVSTGDDYVEGEVTHYVADNDIYRVKYKNGEMEKLSLTELMMILVDQSILAPIARHRSDTEKKEDLVAMKRGRGRPPKALKHDHEAGKSVDHGTSQAVADHQSRLEQSSGAGITPKRRGRPPKVHRVGQNDTYSGEQSDDAERCLPSPLQRRSEASRLDRTPSLQANVGGTSATGKAAEVYMIAVEADIVSRSDAACGNGCEADDNEATHWCRECELAICAVCVMTHRRQAPLKGHFLTEISVATATADATTLSVQSHDEQKSKEVRESSSPFPKKRRGRPPKAQASGAKKNAEEENDTVVIEDDSEANPAAGVSSEVEVVEGCAKIDEGSGFDRRTDSNERMCDEKMSENVRAHDEGTKKGSVHDEDEDEDEEDEEDGDGSNDYCEVCGGDGELVCCDYCECAYHGPKCLNARAEDLPDPWKCPKCCGNFDEVKTAYMKRKTEKRLAKEAKLARAGKKKITNNLGGSSDDDKDMVRKGGRTNGKGRKKLQLDSDDEMQDGDLDHEMQDADIDDDSSEADDEFDGDDDAKSADSGKLVPRHGRLTRKQAAELGIEVDTKKARSRYAEAKSDTASSGTVSDSSEDREKSADEEEEGDSPSKGPMRKRIKRAKELSRIMLQAAEEGRERDAKRQQAKEEAAVNLGKQLILKAPAQGDGKQELDVMVPEHMSEQLQPHQRVGVKFLWDCCIRESRGAILAHCMGLGKTFQCITTLQCVWQHALELKEKPRILILAPVNVIRNWETEFDKWLPDPDSGLAPPIFTMVEAGSVHADRADYLEEWVLEGGIMLMGYEQFRNLSSGRGIRKGKKNEGIKERYRCALLDPGPYMVVCDEGHILRRELSGVTQAVRAIKTMRRVVLSGTPMQNNLIEYHCMVDFVRPGLIGDVNSFKRDFVAPILNGQCIDSTPADVRQMRKRSHILNSMLKGVVDRADFKVLQPYLKPKHEFIIGMRLSALQIALYKSILDENVPTIGADGKGMGKFVGLRVLGTYHKLSKVWTHPKVLLMQRAQHYDSMDDFIASDSEERSWSDEEERRKKKERKKTRNSKGSNSGSDSDKEEVRGEWLEKYHDELESMASDAMGKMLFLSKLLKEAHVVGDKVLLFSQSLLVLDLIEDMLTQSKKRGHALVDSNGRPRKWQCGVDYFRLDGTTNGDKRKREIDKFNRSKKARLYLISTRAGSLGVNLVSANRVVIMDASWNPSYDTQAIFRVYRFGQQKDCFVYRLLAHGTMEQKIYGRQVTKQALSSRVVDSEETGRHFSSNELGALFEFSPGPTSEEVAAEQSALLSSSKTEEKKQEGQEYVLDLSKAKTIAPGDATRSLDMYSDAPEAPVDGVGEGSAGAAAPAGADHDKGKGKESEEGESDNGKSGTSNLFAATCLPPKDAVLARVLGELMPQWVVGYHEADSLNEVETELSPEEVALAWKEWEEKDKIQPQHAPQVQQNVPSLIVRNVINGVLVEEKVPVNTPEGRNMLLDHQRSLIAQWRQYQDANGRSYFHHRASGVSQWNPPDLWPGTVLGFGIDPKMVPGLTQVVEQALRQHADQIALQQTFANTHGAAGAASAGAGTAGPVPQNLNTSFLDQQRLLANARISAPATSGSGAPNS